MMPMGEGEMECFIHKGNLVIHNFLNTLILNFFIIYLMHI